MAEINIEKYAGREMSIFGYKKELECYPSTIGYDEKDIRYANWINKYADYNWIFEEQKEKTAEQLFKESQQEKTTEQHNDGFIGSVYDGYGVSP